MPHEMSTFPFLANRIRSSAAPQVEAALMGQSAQSLARSGKGVLYGVPYSPVDPAWTKQAPPDLRPKTRSAIMAEMQSTSPTCG
jgi:hypothetical protein